MSKVQWCLFGLAFGIIIGGSLANNSTKNKFQKQAIEHGAAHYDKVTGNWEWNK